jgi:acetone carboxylase gamma subunit
VLHEVRAEYDPDETPGKPDARVSRWHMVRGTDTMAMCGRELHPESATRPEEEWGRTREPFCHSCGALYLREVP